MYLSAPKIHIIQRAARSILDKNKPICVTEWNKTELLWKQISQQNFSEVNGLQLYSQSPWGTYLLFSAIRSSSVESLRSMSALKAYNSNDKCFPWDRSFWYQHPYSHFITNSLPNTWWVYSSDHVSINPLSFSPPLNMLINISGWVFTYLHTAHLLWKKLALPQS